MKADQFYAEKIFYHANKIQMFLNQELTLPSVIELSLSGLCNHDCVYCCCSAYKSPHMLSKSQINTIISQLQSFIRAITITGGGEPTLNHNFLYCINKIAENGIPYGIITNGSNFTNDQMNAVVSTASFCRISLDSINADIYNQIRRSNNPIEQVLDNIAYMVAAKHKMHTSILIGAQIVCCTQSLNDIENTIIALKNMDVDFVQIRPMDNIPYRDFSINYQKNINYRNGLINFKSKYSDLDFKVIPNVNKFDEYYNYSVGKNYVGCPGGNFTASIGHDNKVYFCCTHIGNERYLLGDLAYNSLIDILLSHSRKDIISNCDHIGCQYQCRNHNINKILSQLKNETATQIYDTYSKINLKSRPLHWEFL